MTKKYILDENGAPKEAGLSEWAMWFDMAGRDIKKTQVGDIKISTVFIGLDGELFETMVFGGKLDEQMERYDTREEAIKGHEKMVERVKHSV